MRSSHRQEDGNCGQGVDQPVRQDWPVDRAAALAQPSKEQTAHEGGDDTAKDGRPEQPARKNVAALKQL